MTPAESNEFDQPPIRIDLAANMGKLRNNFILIFLIFGIFTCDMFSVDGRSLLYAKIWKYKKESLSTHDHLLKEDI